MSDTDPGKIDFLAECPHCAQLRPQSRRRPLLLFQLASLEPIECSCSACNQRWLASTRDRANIQRLLRRGARAVVFWMIAALVCFAELDLMV